MAKTTVVTDDLDGSSGAETVTFSFQGNQYELDLSSKNIKAMEKTLRPYIDAARKPSGQGSRKPAAASNGRSRGSGRRSGGSGVDVSAVRAWAAENGIEVSTRGRIAKAVIEQYEAAR
jgi:hypothetical protein